MTASLYDPATGKISGTLSAPDEVIQYNAEQSGQAYIDGQSDPRLHYVVDGVLEDRPSNPASLDGHSIISIPNPSTVTLAGTSYEVTDGVAEFEFNLPGTYKVTIQSWPYRDKEILIENSPS